MHWGLGFIDMIKKEVRYYDSMNGSGRDYMNSLLHFIEDEYKNKGHINEEVLEVWKTKMKKNILQ